MVVQPADKAQMTGTNAEFVVRTGDNTDPLTRLEMFVNGVQVTPTAARGFLPVASGTELQKIVVPIGKGENRVLIRATNQVGATERELTIFGTVAGSLDRKGTLFVIAIGVDKYPHLEGFCGSKQCDLKFAGADARAFHDQIMKASKSLHADVNSIVLTNGSGSQEREPTYANTVDAFALLEGSRENDLVVVFLSGHGVNEDVQGRKEYLFLPTDARRLPNGRFRPSSVFSWSALEEGLGKAKGRRMLFVDTCHAANSYNARIVKNAHDDNIAVFSSSDQDTVSVERGDLGHGVFTHVVLRGHRGEAARDQEIRLFGFADFVDQLVRQLTADTQQPEINTQRAKNYVIARTANNH